MVISGFVFAGWISFPWVSISYLDFGSVVAVCCLFSWPVPLECSQGISTGVGGWVTGMNWGKEGWKRKFL